MKKIMFKAFLVVVAISMLATTASAAGVNGFEIFSGDGSITAVTNGFKFSTTDQGNTYVISQQTVSISEPITFDVQIADMYGTKWPNQNSPDHQVEQWILFSLSDGPAVPFQTDDEANLFIIHIAPHAQEGFDRILIDYRKELIGEDFADYGGVGGQYPQFNDSVYAQGSTFSVSLDFSKQNWDVFQIDGNMCSAYPDYDLFRNLFDGEDLYISFGTTALPEGSTADSGVTITNVKNGDRLISVATDDPTTTDPTTDDPTTADPTEAPADSPGDFFSATLYAVLIIASLGALALISTKKKVSVK